MVVEMLKMVASVPTQARPPPRDHSPRLIQSDQYLYWNPNLLAFMLAPPNWMKAEVSNAKASR